MDQLLASLLPALPGLLLLAVLLPLAVHRRRRVLADRRPPGADLEVMTDDPAPEPVDGDGDADGGDGTADEPDVAPTSAEAPLGRHAHVDSRDLATHRRRVDATVQAMARRASTDEAAELTEARVRAALGRLEGPVRFARPSLSPASPHGLLAEGPHRGPALDAAPHATAAQPGPEPALVPAAPEEPEVVLPVPPMAPSTPTRRRRLRLRGRPTQSLERPGP